MSLQSIARIRVVFDALQELAKDVVFVGGATVGLYADRQAAESRPTDDVDILIELLHYKDYADIEVRLRQKGFSNDTESKVICRYRVSGIIVDVMPTGENALGFTNQWYEKGFASSITYPLDDNRNIRIFHPVYFLASKMEAFKNRGGGDGRWSSDFEDIIYVLNNRGSVWKELLESDKEVAEFLKTRFSILLESGYKEEWISVHLDAHEQGRVKIILRELHAFVNGV
jgi:predicted nucleotidyltransferase